MKVQTVVHQVVNQVLLQIIQLLHLVKVTGSDVERYKADIINSATQIEDTMKLIEGIADSDVKSYKQKKSEVQLSLGGAKATTKKLKNLQAPLSYRRTGEDKAVDGTICGLFSTSFDALDQEDESKNASIIK